MSIKKDAQQNKVFDYDYQCELKNIWADKLAIRTSEVLAA